MCIKFDNHYPIDSVLIFFTRFNNSILQVLYVTLIVDLEKQ